MEHGRRAFLKVSGLGNGTLVAGHQRSHTSGRTDLADLCFLSGSCRGGFSGFEGWQAASLTAPQKQHAVGWVAECPNGSWQASTRESVVKEIWLTCAFLALALGSHKRFHTSYGPSRHPCLCQGWGRRITGQIAFIPCLNELWFCEAPVWWLNPHCRKHLGTGMA